MWGIGLLCEESNIVGIMGSTGAQALRARDCKQECLLNCWCGAILSVKGVTANCLQKCLSWRTVFPLRVSVEALHEASFVRVFWWCFLINIVILKFSRVDSSKCGRVLLSSKQGPSSLNANPSFVVFNSSFKIAFPGTLVAPLQIAEQLTLIRYFTTWFGEMFCIIREARGTLQVTWWPTKFRLI